jgi:hypothetical protein
VRAIDYSPNFHKVKGLAMFETKGAFLNSHSGFSPALAQRLSILILLLAVAMMTTSCGTPTQAAGMRNTQDDQKKPTTNKLNLSGNLPVGTVDESYNAVLAVGGGSSPYHFSVKAGILPPGISLNQATGTFSGMPSTAGTFSFEVVVTDSPRPNQGSPTFGGKENPTFGGRGSPTPVDQGSKTFVIVIDGDSGGSSGTVKVGVSPASATLSSSQTQQFTATVSGTSNTGVKWSAAGGSVDANGLYTAPTVKAKTSVIVTATSNADLSKSVSAAITVDPVNKQAMQITTGGTLPQGQQGDSYSEVFTATGGTTPYSWSISAGTPPPGIAMNANGNFAGMPTAVGTFNFTVTVTDATGNTAPGNFSVTIIAVSISGSSCGPQNGYDCFVQDTSIVNLTMPIPSWGPNTCDSTSLDTLSACGNLTGAGTAQTPSDFGNQMVRITDVNTPSTGYDTLYTYDDPFPTAWNKNDTGILAREMDSTGYNPIMQVVMPFNPTTMQATLTSPLLSFIGQANWSHTANNIIYSYGATGSNRTKLYSNVVVMTPGSASLTPTLMFDFNSPTCLTNPVNGYTGGSFTATWNGVMTSSLDDTVFAMAWSNTGNQGSGTYVTAWTVGQSGCDVYNTVAGNVTHNGVLVGTVPDQWGAAANGGIPDLFKLHDTFTALNDGYVWLDASISTVSQGVYNDGPYIWQIGTATVKHCGIGASNWTANHLYNVLGYRIQPATNVNPGNYIYQIIASGNEGTSGSSAPAWNQTPGSNTTDGTVTWRNTGLGTAQEYYCDGHNWYGYTGLTSEHQPLFHSYSNPSTTLAQQLTGPYLYGDSHYGSTNDNADDTAWIFNVAALDSQPVNLLGTLPSWGFREVFFISPINKAPGVPNDTGAGGTLGQVRGAFHTYNTGYSWAFDIQNGTSMISQTGNFALVSTDGMGQFGNLSGQSQCNVGGPNWEANDSTDYTVGEKVFPNPQYGGNAGHYIYQIQSCSGTCTTGATKPTFVQSATVAGVGTFTDGTITWAAAPDTYISTNTAVQNCRADLMVVKLTR